MLVAIVVVTVGVSVTTGEGCMSCVVVAGSGTSELKEVVAIVVVYICVVAGIFVVCEAVVVVLIVVVVLGTAVVILVVVLPFSVVVRCVVVVVLPVTVLTVEVLSVVVVTAVVRRTAVTSMNENVVGRGGSTAPLLFFLCVVVTAGAFSPDTVVTVVPFCAAELPL